MMYRKKKVLIIGKVPPPIGGVSIHVSRLLDRLNKSEFSYALCKTSIKNVILYLYEFKKFNIVHIHTTHAFLRCFLSLWLKLFKTKSIITFHGKLGVSSFFRNMLDNIAIRTIDIPIVLNKHSLKWARNLNSKAEIIGAFIPPSSYKELNSNVREQILNLKQKYKVVFATNAHNYSTDANGKEIYGIKELIENFKNQTDYALVISNSSGKYRKIISDRIGDIPQNVFFISEPHSYYAVLKLIDINIRNTSTDGDSISVKEALFLNVFTMATNVVDRPNGVYLYDPEKLANALMDVIKDYQHLISQGNLKESSRDDSITLFNLYNKLINAS